MSEEEYGLQWREKEKSVGYTVCSNVLLYAYPNVSDNAKIAYLTMISLDWSMVGQKMVWYSQKKLAFIAGKAHRSFQRYIRELKEAGLITIKKAKGQGRRFVIYFEPLTEKEVHRAYSKKEYLLKTKGDYNLKNFNESFEMTWKLHSKEAGTKNEPHRTNRQTNPGSGTKVHTKRDRGGQLRSGGGPANSKPTGRSGNGLHPDRGLAETSGAGSQPSKERPNGGRGGSAPDPKV